MNQGRIWCVVNPTVGLPLFLGSVALTSLAVHAAVMTHTNWMGNYWAGSSRVKAAMTDGTPQVAQAAPTAQPAFVISVAPVAASAGKTDTSFVVTVTPNPAAAAQAEERTARTDTLALATPTTK